MTATRSPKKPGIKRETKPEGAGTAFANFLIERLESGDGSASKMTNDAVAEYLGYARPNIVSAWKGARTKVAMDNIMPLSELLEVDPAYLMGLYVEQYTKTGQDVDRFPEIMSMMSRIATEEEWELLCFLRELRRGHLPRLDEIKKKELERIFGGTDVPEGEGYYKPVERIVPDKPTVSRLAIRRGAPRDMSVDELEERMLKGEEVVSDGIKLRKRSTASRKAAAE